MSNFDWNEATTQRLRDLWVQIPQLSTAEIGRRMGVSKNAVVGKAHRLDLPARPSPILYSGSEDPYARRRKTEKPLREAPRAPRVTLAPLASVAALAPVPAPSLVRIQEPKSRPVAVRAPSLCLVVSILRCCRPLNDGRPWKFCNKPVETAGRQYCDECHDACYVKVRDRREDVVA